MKWFKNLFKSKRIWYSVIDKDESGLYYHVMTTDCIQYYQDTMNALGIKYNTVVLSFEYTMEDAKQEALKWIEERNPKPMKEKIDPCYIQYLHLDVSDKLIVEVPIDKYATPKQVTDYLREVRYHLAVVFGMETRFVIIPIRTDETSWFTFTVIRQMKDNFNETS